MEEEPSVLLDVVGLTPHQEGIVELLATLVAGSFILWQTGSKLVSEIKKTRDPEI